MSDTESTPRLRGRPTPSTSKDTAEKTTPNLRARPAKKVVEKRSTSRNKKTVEESQAVATSSEDEDVNKRRSSRKKGKKDKEAAPVVSDNYDSDEVVKTVRTRRLRSSTSTPAVQKEVHSEEEELNEAEPDAEDLPSSSKVVTRSAKQNETKTTSKSTPRGRADKEGRKHVETEEEEEEEDEKAVTLMRTRSARNRGQIDETEEREREKREKEGAEENERRSRSMRRGRRAVESEDEEEEKETKKPMRTTRSTVKGRKTKENEVEEEKVKNKRAASNRKGKKEKERMEEKDEESSSSRVRRRIDYEGEKDEKRRGKGKKEKQGMISLETPEKKVDKPVEERKKTRTTRRILDQDDDIDMSVDEEEDTEETEEIDINDEESGDETSVHVLSEEDRKVGTAIVKTIRMALKSVFASKDIRTFRNAVVSITKAKAMAYEREDHKETSRAFYNEIECQLQNMMEKAEGEKKVEYEPKQRVLQVLAKALVEEFNELLEEQYDGYWSRIEYLLNKFATAENAYIRSMFCFWVSLLLKYSKLIHVEENGHLSKDDMERMHLERLKEKGEEDGVDEDRRLIDGHILKLSERKRLYLALYQSLKHHEECVRIAAVRALSPLQDEPIPPTFTEAVKHSPKDLIMRQLMDIHVSVRKAAVEELRPTTDEQIEYLLKCAMQEKHEDLRRETFVKLGRLKIVQFNLTQRHSLLAMLRDNTLGPTIETAILYSWLYEMVTDENPNPIVSEESNKGRKKKETGAHCKGKWASAPLSLLRYLDCVNHSDDVLIALRKCSAIARKESGSGLNSVAIWISNMIDHCVEKGMGLITKTDYRHLLQRELSDEGRALIVTYWLHSLQFVHENKKNDGDVHDGVDLLSPSMGDIRQVIEDLLGEERERRKPRKEMVEKGQIDVTHPAFLPTSPQLQSILSIALRAFRYLKPADDDAREEWRRLLMTLSRGELCDVSPSMWEVIMHDLLKFHCKEGERNDLIYEVAINMGVDYDSIVRGEETGGIKSPKRRSTEAMDKSSTPTSSRGKNEEEEKRMEDRRLVLSRPDCLGMITGALKTGYFDSSAEALTVIFKYELDAYRSVRDNRLLAVCIECIGMFGVRSSEVAERYIGLLMENLLKSVPQMDDNGQEEEEKTKKKKRKRIERVEQDDLEMEYMRRDKEEKERKETERMSKRGGVNHCKGLALAAISDLIVAHSSLKVWEWLESSGEGEYSDRLLVEYMERMALEQDLELVFVVSHCTNKLAVYDGDLMRQLTKTVALLMLRVMHPSSFAHSRLRSCVCGFFIHYGSKSTENQIILSEVVVDMLSILEERDAHYTNVIPKGSLFLHAVHFVVSTFAPSALKIRDDLTAHSVLLNKLIGFVKKMEEKTREKEDMDIDYYKAVLSAIQSMDYSGMSASTLRSLFDVLTENIEKEVFQGWDKGGEAKKMSGDILKTVDNHIQCVNEIIRLNKALGVTLTDDQALLPYRNEAVQVMEELRERVNELGLDIREFSPVRDGRPPRGQWTPLNTKKRGRGEGSELRGILSSLKKEPARSKSYAATAAAERKERGAASSTSTPQKTPTRPSTRPHLRRVGQMSTIQESD